MSQRDRGRRRHCRRLRTLLPSFRRPLGAAVTCQVLKTPMFQNVSKCFNHMWQPKNYSIFCISKTLLNLIFARPNWVLHIFELYLSLHILCKTWLDVTYSLQPLTYLYKPFAAPYSIFCILCEPHLTLDTLCKTELNFTSSLCNLIQIFLDLQKFHNICMFGLLHVWAVLPVTCQNWTFQNKIEQAFPRPRHVIIPLNLG